MEIQSLAKLAKTNINILGVSAVEGDWLVLYEYQWRTPSGHPKWSRGVYRTPESLDLDKAAEEVYQRVQELRSELEG